MGFPEPSRTGQSTSEGTRTTTITATETAEVSFASNVRIPASGSLHLRSSAESGLAEQDGESEGRHVQWAETVVNNEGMGKKSSKVCCIYHRPRAVGESSDEEDSSSSDSDSDNDEGSSENDRGAARPARRAPHLPGPHTHGDLCDHTDSNSGSSASFKGKARKQRGPNAYERIPRNTQLG